ncbi:MAG: AAA family ATPase [Sedimentisphaerales bacterium]|nr:AAA family ATPase [Sedimentisphaerales bacterium]
MESKEAVKGLVDVEELKTASGLARRMLSELDKIMLGRSDLHKMVLVGILGRGHILLEGVPGVGKTMLVKALGELMNLQFKRVQFTPDLMPGDILGTHILQETDGARRMVFQQGPVFTNILLADEINRASPKTQSALLEAMQERCVTLLGETRSLPDPFFVLASQNPIELEGTYPLPEAQLDRFLFKLRVDCADVEVMKEIISTRRRGEPPKPGCVVRADELAGLFGVMDKIFLPEPVSNYISRLVAATHPASPEATESVKNYVSYGASPRAAIAIAEAARGCAIFAVRPSVGFEDVRAVVSAVLNHRIILNYKAKFDQIDTITIINDLLGSLDETAMNLPQDVKIRETPNV